MKTERMFLTPAQLTDLTGYRMATYQIRWLQKRRIEHRVRGDGRPSVRIAALCEWAMHPIEATPDFDAVRKEPRTN